VGHKLTSIQWIQSILVTVYLLELVGATAITSLGWAACRILQIDPLPSAPLWFAGYLLVYNLDRVGKEEEEDDDDQVSPSMSARRDSLDTS
jgi:hypothetical protein